MMGIGISVEYIMNIYSDPALIDNISIHFFTETTILGMFSQNIFKRSTSVYTVRTITYIDGH